MKFLAPAVLVLISIGTSSSATPPDAQWKGGICYTNKGVTGTDDKMTLDACIDLSGKLFLSHGNYTVGMRMAGTATPVPVKVCYMKDGTNNVTFSASKYTDTCRSHGAAQAGEWDPDMMG